MADVTRPTTAADGAGATSAPEASTGVEIRDSVAARPVADVMSQPVVAVTPDMNLSQALQTLTAAGHMRHLVVLSEHGRCLGVLSDRALAAEWARDPADFGTRLVREVVDFGAPVAQLTDPVSAAARTMLRTGTDAVAVADSNDRVQGILTATDLVALLGTGRADRTAAEA
jgi:CBS domain-containing protein